MKARDLIIDTESASLAFSGMDFSCSLATAKVCLELALTSRSKLNALISRETYEPNLGANL